jgi:hypothetical protein
MNPKRVFKWVERYIVEVPALLLVLLAAPLLSLAEVLRKTSWLPRLLTGVLFGSLIGAVAGALLSLLVGCASTPAPAANPQDPEIFRPSNPQYPLP